MKAVKQKIETIEIKISKINMTKNIKILNEKLGKKLKRKIIKIWNENSNVKCNTIYRSNFFFFFVCIVFFFK